MEILNKHIVIICQIEHYSKFTESLASIDYSEGVATDKLATYFMMDLSVIF